MIPAFVEGLRSSVLPCSLTLIVPIAAVALASRKRPVVAVTVATIGALVTMWIRAAGLVSGGRATAIVLAVLTIGVATWWLLPGSSPGADALVALIPGALAGWLWQPCVGEVLGGILAAAGRRAVSSVPMLAAYSVGVLIAAFLIALARVALGDPRRLTRVLRVAGSILALALAALVLVRLDSRVVSWLVELSV